MSDGVKLGLDRLFGHLKGMWNSASLLEDCSDRFETYAAKDVCN